MPRPEDMEAAKTVRKEFARRPIDTSLMMVTTAHGVVRLGGQVKAMRGHQMDIRSEMALIAKVLKQKPGIRDVVLDCIMRE
ncbi:MAG: hypothetical protein ABIV13_05820 [Fimbriimonadales bacterium]